MSQVNSKLQKVPKGYKQSEAGIIPADWVVFDIASLSSKVGSGKTPKGGSSVYLNTGRPLVRSQNIGWGRLLLDDIAYISEEIHETFLGSELREGDVLLNITGASIGRCAVANIDLSGGNVNQHVCIIRVDPNKVDPRILANLILSSDGQNQIDSFQAGGNREGLNFTQVKTIKFQLAESKKEQTAIAKALFDVDTLITSLEKLIDKKRSIKTAAMQQLLTGKKRLPPYDTLNNKNGTSRYKQTELGQIPEDWDAGLLPNYIWYQEGPGLRKWQFTNKGMKVINVTNLQYSGVLDLDKTDRHISFEEFEKMYRHFECDVGDFVMASSGNSYGKCSLVRECDLPLLMNTSVIRFKNLEAMNNSYMQIFLKSKYFKDQIDLLITGGAQPNFGPVHLNKILLAVPSCLEEQEAIASILISMEKEIIALEKRLNKTQQIKQGMMQELLTGRTRLV